MNIVIFLYEMSTTRKRFKSRNDWEFECLFIQRPNGNAQCIICEKVQKEKLSNLFRHYNEFHKNTYENYCNNERRELVQSYRNKINAIKENEKTLFSCSDNQINSSNNPIPNTSLHVISSKKQSLVASYAVALEIGEKKTVSVTDYL